MEKSGPAVTIFTDGACSGNPGMGGWAAILMLHRTVRIIVGFEPHTTNNRMELSAAIASLQALTKSSEVKLFTDSRYVLDGITRYIHTWKQNKWRTASKTPVVSVDLWVKLSELASIHQVHWNWVPGHADNRFNNFADLLARASIKSGEGIDLKIKVNEFDDLIERHHKPPELMSQLRVLQSLRS